MEILGMKQVDAIIDEAIQQGALEGIEGTLGIRAVDELSDRYIKYHRLLGVQRDEMAEELIRERLSLPDILEKLDKGAPATGWKQTVEVSAGELYLVEFGSWEKYEDFEPEVILEVRNPEIDREALSRHKERLKEALVDSGIYQRWSEAELEAIGGNIYPGAGEDQEAYDHRYEGIMDLFAELFTEISIEMENKESEIPISSAGSRRIAGFWGAVGLGLGMGVLQDANSYMFIMSMFSLGLSGLLLLQAILLKKMERLIKSQPVRAGPVNKPAYFHRQAGKINIHPIIAEEFSRFTLYSAVFPHEVVHFINYRIARLLGGFFYKRVKNPAVVTVIRNAADSLDHFLAYTIGILPVTSLICVAVLPYLVSDPRLKKAKFEIRIEKQQQMMIEKLQQLEKPSEEDIGRVEIETIANVFKADTYKYSLDKETGRLGFIISTKDLIQESSYTEPRVAKDNDEKEMVCSIAAEYFNPGTTMDERKAILTELLEEQARYEKSGRCGWQWIVDRDGHGGILVNEFHGLRGLHIKDREKLPNGYVSRNIEEDERNYRGRDMVKEMFFGFAEQNGNVDIFLITNWPQNKRQGYYFFLANGNIDLVSRTLYRIVERTNKELSILRKTKKLELLSTKDGLTGLYNRRYFDERLEGELRRSRRNKRPLSLLMMDIDNFKKVNDRFGHTAGDGVLSEFARIVEDNVREKIDLTARYGGEEFAIILPDTGLQAAGSLAERIRKAVNETKINIGEKRCNVTVSIGVATFSVEDDLTGKELIKRADKALYRCKEEGRNRVTLWEEGDAGFVTMKAPGSLSMDEDTRIDKQYITGLISKATERTGEVNITEAAAHINRHAPPFRDAKIEPGRIRMYTADGLGDKLGIPRFKNAQKASDLVYAHGVFDEQEDILKIYVTKGYFERYLKGDPLALAELIDHEYVENVLGYSHRVAASRSRNFIPEKGFLSPFHYFYINRITGEDDYSLAKSLVPERGASEDVIKASKGDKDAIREIESYENLFFGYLRLLEWIRKADKEKDHDVLAEYALRAYKILERYPEVILAEGQREIYQRISPERFYIHEYESAKKVSMPLSEFSFDEFEHYDESMVFLGSKFGSGGELYCKGKKKPLITIKEHPGRKIAFSLKNKDLYRVWILDDGNNVIDFRQMGQIYETDGMFRKRFYYKITRSQFNELGDCIIKEHRLDAVGTLHIGGRVVRFGAYYANCKVEIKVRSGQIDSVGIFDEHGLPVKEADFVLIFDKKGRLKGSFYRNLTRNELEKLDDVTLKRLRLNSRGALYLGSGGKDPVPYFHRHPDAEIEIDMIQGHIDKVRILGSDGEVVEEHIFKLVYDEKGRITCSFHEDMAEDDLKKITGRITRLKTDDGGHLRAGAETLGTFTGRKNCPAEAEVERGIPKVIRFYEDMETRKPAGKPARYRLIYDARGRLMDSFRKQYSKAARERLKRATVKEFYLNKGASLKFGERYWATFKRKKYGGRKVEFDVVDGIVTEVRIFDRQGKNIEKTCPFSLVYEIGGKGKEKLVDSFRTAYGPEKFGKLTNHVIRNLRLGKYGALDIGGRVGSNKNMPRAKFADNPGDEVVVYVKDAEVTRVTDIAGNELKGTYFGRDKTGANEEDKLDRYTGEELPAAETVDLSAYRMPKKPFEILKEKIKEAAAKGEITDKDHEQFLRHGLAWIDKGPRTHFINNSKIYSLAMEAMNTGSGADDQIRDYRDLMKYIQLYLRTKYIIKKFKREYDYDIVKQVMARLKDYSRYPRLLEFYRDQYGTFLGEDRKEDEEALLEDLISRFAANRALGGGTVELLDEKGINRSLDDFCPLVCCVIKDGLWMFENELDKIKDIILKKNTQLKDKYEAAKEKQEQLKKRTFQLLNKAPHIVKQLVEIIHILDPQAEARSGAQKDAAVFEGYIKEDIVIIAGYLRSSGHNVLDHAVLKEAFVSLKDELMVIGSFDIFLRAVGVLDRRNMIDAVFEESISFESSLVSHMRDLNGTRNMGSRLRSLTAASGLSSDQAAKEIGCSCSTMRAWRAGEFGPSPGYLPKMADVFSRRLGEPVSTSLLVYGEPLNDVLQKTATFGERLFILAQLSGLDADETGEMIGREGETIGSWTREFNTPQEELDYFKLAGIFSRCLKEKIEVTTLMFGMSLDEFLRSEKVKAPKGDEEIQVTPGLRIRVLRLACGLTTTELAEKAGVPHGTRSLVNKWQSNEVLPRAGRLLKLSRIFSKVKKDIEVTHIVYGRSLTEFLSRSGSFGERIEAIRLASGSDRKQMAEAMKIHLATLRAWRKRVDPPVGDRAITLLDVYHRGTGKYLDGCLLFYGKTLNTLLDEIDRSEGFKIIRYFRISAGLSKKEVSDKLGVDVNALWQWESGEGMPCRGNIAALTEMFKEVFAARDIGISVKIVDEYLVPLLLISSGHTDRGPALFVDQATGDVRALKGEHEGAGMISEHDAVNMVCDELVFKRQRPPLAEGDPLYDFVSEIAPETDIYVIDDAALKQGLEEIARKNNQPGLAGLAQGLITHAGTWRDPATGLQKAQNMFIPASVYELLLGFLERRPLMEQVVPLLGFWRAHEIGHLIDREYDLDDELPEGAKDMARLILLLSKAQRAMEEGRLTLAQKYADTAMELHPGFNFTLDLRLRIQESGSGMSGVRESMMAVLSANMREKAMIIRRHPPEDNVLDTLESKAGKNPKRLSLVVQVLLREAFEAIKTGGPALAEFLDDLKIRGAGLEQGLSDPEKETVSERDVAGQGMQDIGNYVVLPVVCRYITRALEESPKLTWQMSVVEKLMDLAGEGRIGGKTEVYHEEYGYRTSLLSYIYYLGARAYMAADLHKAVMYFGKSIQQDRPMPVSFTGLALSLVESDRSEGSFERAYRLLEQARDKFGDLAVIAETEDILRAEQEKTEAAYREARKLFKSGDYAACRQRISEERERLQTTALFPSFKKFEEKGGLGRLLSGRRGSATVIPPLAELNAKNETLLRLKYRARQNLSMGDYDQAEKRFRAILEQNPSDSEVERLLLDISSKREETEEKRTAEKLGLSAECLKKAEEHLSSGDRMVSQGQMESAEENYKKAMIELKRAPRFEKAAVEVDEKIREVVRRIDSAKKEITEKISKIQAEKQRQAGETGVIFSGDVAGAFDRAFYPEEREVIIPPIPGSAQKIILEALRKVSEGDERNVRDIPGRGDVWVCFAGVYRMVFTLTDSGDIFVVWAGSKDLAKYKKVLAPLPEGFDSEKMLPGAVRIEDLGKKPPARPEKATMKAPGSLSMDEDRRIDKQYITGLISNAAERTWEASIPAAAEYINRHAQPFRGAHIEPGGIRIFTVDSLGDRMGIPRFRGAEKASDLVYAYGVFDEQEDDLKIYVTRAYFEAYLKDDIIALAEIIDHEYTENVLGYSHRVAASRSRKFVPEGGFLSPFHYFYINRITGEGDYSLTKSLVPARAVPDEVVKAPGSDKGATREIGSYENLFFSYLRLLEWLRKADAEKDHKILAAEYASRAYEILERYPEIVLTEEQREIYERISTEGSHVREHKTARKVLKLLPGKNKGAEAGRSGYRMPKGAFETFKREIGEAVDKGEVSRENHEQFLRHGLAWRDKGPEVHFINNSRIYSLARKAMNTVLGEDDQIEDYRDVFKYIRLCLRTRHIIKEFKKKYDYDVIKQTMARLKEYSQYSRLLEFYRYRYGEFVDENGREDEKALFEDLISRFVADRALGRETIELLDEKGITRRLDEFWPLASCVIKDGLGMLEMEISKVKDWILKDNTELKGKYEAAKEKQEQVKKRIFPLLNRTPHTEKELIRVIRILGPQAEIHSGTFEDAFAFEGYLKEDILIIARHLRSSGHGFFDRPVLEKIFVSLKDKLMAVDSFDKFLKVVGFLDHKNMFDAVLETSINSESALVSHMRDLKGIKNKAKRLRSLIAASGLSVKQVTEEVGCSMSAMSAWRSGGYEPLPGYLHKMADVFSRRLDEPVSTSLLVYGEPLNAVLRKTSTFGERLFILTALSGLDAEGIGRMIGRQGATIGGWTRGFYAPQEELDYFRLAGIFSKCLKEKIDVTTLMFGMSLDKILRSGKVKAPEGDREIEVTPGLRIRVLRLECGLLPVELAKKAGVSRGVRNLVNRWQRDAALPRPGRLLNMSRIFSRVKKDIEVTHILYGKSLAEFLSESDSFWERVEAVRLASGLSIGRMAEELRIDPITVNRWMKKTDTSRVEDGLIGLVDIYHRQTGKYLDGCLLFYGKTLNTLLNEVDRSKAFEIIRYFRVSAGLSRKEVSDELGVDVNTVRRWEQGEVMPYREKVVALTEMYEEVFAAGDNGISAGMVEEYFVSLLLFRPRYVSTGPALFVDPATQDVRALKGEPGGDGMISEHDAVNMACDELVFKRQRPPLAAGDPLYDFVSEISPETDIYVIDDAELKEELARMGYAYLAEGLITHAGTWRDPETGQQRARNLFIPDSVYGFLLKLLEKKDSMPDADVLVEFWRLHEKIHFALREVDIDGMIAAEETREMAKLILLLSRAERALEKGMTEQALEYTEQAIELNRDLAVTLELKARVNEARKDWSAAYQDYLIALAETNLQLGVITIGHPLENKALELIKKITKAAPREVFRGVMNQAEFLENLARAGSVSEEGRERPFITYFGILPVTCRYAAPSSRVGPAQWDPAMTQFQTAVVDRLLELLKAGKLVNPLTGQEDGRVSSYIYYLAGEASRSAGDIDQAVAYFRESIRCDEPFSEAPAALAVSLAQRHETPGSVEEAHQVLSSAGEEFGSLDIFDSAREYVRQAEEWIMVHEEALEQFRRCDYSGCQRRITEARKTKGETALPGPLNVSLGNLQKSARSADRLKNRGMESFEKRDYPEAEKCFEQVLRENPADEEAGRLHRQILEQREERQNKITGAATADKRDQEAGKCYLAAEKFRLIAQRQAHAGRIGKARKNYEKALAELEKAPFFYDPASRMREQINKNLDAIKGLPDTAVRKKPESPKRKKRKRAAAVESEVPGEIEGRKDIKGIERQVFLSREASDMLTKKKVVSNKDRENILEAVRAVSRVPDRETLKKLYLNLHGSLWSRKVGKLNVIFTIMDDENILVLRVGKLAKTARKKMVKTFPEHFDYRPVLENAVKIEDLGKKPLARPERSTMKAPASLSMDEDRRIDKQYITGLISKAVERTWEVNIPDAAEYINRHARPFNSAHIEPGGIRIFTVDNLGNKPGIPRFRDAEKASDLVYAYGVFDEQEDELKIYVTRGYFEAYLKDDIIALAEIIDHEYTENILGYSHQVAASRSRKFVPKGGFLSPFHYFYINRITEEGDYSLAGSLAPARVVPDEVVKAPGSDKGAAREIGSYENLFFSYLRLLEWLRKADAEKDHNILAAEYALRAHNILERYPEIVLTEEQREIYERISPERFRVREAGRSVYRIPKKAFEILRKKIREAVSKGEITDEDHEQFLRHGLARMDKGPRVNFMKGFKIYFLAREAMNTVLGEDDQIKDYRDLFKYIRLCLRTRHIIKEFKEEYDYDVINRIMTRLKDGFQYTRLLEFYRYQYGEFVDERGEQDEEALFEDLISRFVADRVLGRESIELLDEKGITRRLDDFWPLASCVIKDGLGMLEMEISKVKDVILKNDTELNGKYKAARGKQKRLKNRIFSLLNRVPHTEKELIRVMRILDSQDETRFGLPWEFKGFLWEDIEIITKYLRSFGHSLLDRPVLEKAFVSLEDELMTVGSFDIFLRVVGFLDHENMFDAAFEASINFESAFVSHMRNLNGTGRRRIGNRLRSLTVASGLSAGQAAGEVGCSVPAMLAWRSGKYAPSPEYFPKMADVFSRRLGEPVSTSLLVYGEPLNDVLRKASTFGERLFILTALSGLDAKGIAGMIGRKDATIGKWAREFNTPPEQLDYFKLAGIFSERLKEKIDVTTLMFGMSLDKFLRSGKVRAPKNDREIRVTPGLRIRVLRLSCGLTTTELSQKTGILRGARTLVNRWQRDEAVPLADRLLKMCRIFSSVKKDIEVTHILYGKPLVEFLSESDSFGERVEAVRLASGLSKSLMAEAMKINPATLRQWTKRVDPPGMGDSKMALLDVYHRVTGKYLDGCLLFYGKTLNTLLDDVDRSKGSEIIRYFRLSAGLGMKEVSDKLGVDMETVRRWEEWERLPGRENMLDLTEMFREVFAARENGINARMVEEYFVPLLLVPLNHAGGSAGPYRGKTPGQDLKSLKRGHADLTEKAASGSTSSIPGGLSQTQDKACMEAAGVTDAEARKPRGLYAQVKKIDEEPSRCETIWRMEFTGEGRKEAGGLLFKSYSDNNEIELHGIDVEPGSLNRGYSKVFLAEFVRFIRNSDEFKGFRFRKTASVKHPLFAKTLLRFGFVPEEGSHGTECMIARARDGKVPVFIRDPLAREDFKKRIKSRSRKGDYDMLEILDSPVSEKDLDREVLIDVNYALKDELKLKNMLEIYGKDTKGTAEQPPEVSWGGKEIMENARSVIPWLIQSMIEVSENISTGKRDEKVVLLLDTELAELGEKRVENEIERLIRLFANVKDNNKALRRFLGNLEIRKGKAGDLLNKKGAVRAENIIVVTKSSNMKHFKSIEGRAVIAAVDDRDFPGNAYLPFLEVTLFAIGKYLGWDESMLREHYANIPNVVPVKSLSERDYKGLFGRDMKNVIIKLIPDAGAFDTEELVRTMARIRDILRKA
ncbi:MAG: diguanylate cyclase [Candidatus Omnitrophota bacterium]|nr:diguanylate cyclase [Candidatus Omnitrophota bacterium]